MTRTLGQTVGIAVLGALWATRTAFYTGNAIGVDATSASASSQVAALNDTYLVTTGLIAVALLLAVWGLVNELRGETGPLA